LVASKSYFIFSSEYHVCMYDRVMTLVGLVEMSCIWSVHMHVFTKGLEKMYAYIAEILCRMFSL